MTAAGSSAADALHKLYDQASYALGYGEAATADQADNGEQDAGKTQGDRKGPASGPGNHPDPDRLPKEAQHDHSHDEYKPRLTVDEDADTRIDEADASVGGHGLAKARQSAARSDRRGDALERALGDEGPTGDSQNATLGRELAQDAYVRKQAQANETSRERQQGASAATASEAGAMAGEPLQSERNQQAAEDARPPTLLRGRKKQQWRQERKDEKDQTERRKLITEQHPNQKGPMWASRPDDEQRERIRRLTAERQGRDGKASYTKRAWAKLKRSGSGYGDDDQREDKQGEKEHDDSAPGLGDSTPFSSSEADTQGDPTTVSTDAQQDEQHLRRKVAGHDGNSERNQRSRSTNRLSMLFSTDSGRSKGGQGDQPTPEEESRDSDIAAAGEENTPSTPTSQQNRMTKISKMMLGGNQAGRHDMDQSDAKEPAAGVSSSGGEDMDNGTVRGIDGVKATNGTPPPSARWNVLRQRFRDSAAKRGKAGSERKARVVGQMSVVTELQTGILPVFMLKMSLERDEQGHRRIPVLLNHLRLRVSDSVNPLHTSSAVFRIEMEYGDGLIRWVCYRSLRDFINLHTHYRAAAIKGYLGRPVGAAEGDVGVPSFPKTSLPYFNQLQRQGWGRTGESVKARFAQAQRTALEDYLLEVIKRTMFRPEANRLCKFFEISALSISLAARGGYQGKQGYLRILSRSSRKDAQRGLLTPVGWAKSHEPKWFIVRESYVAVVEQPDSLQVFDVFLLDNAFEIIRPKRLYRQTFHLAHELGLSDKRGEGDPEGGDDAEQATDSNSARSPSKLNKPKQSTATSGKDETAILTEGHFRDPTEDEYSGSRRGRGSSNVSSHTFYIKNAERKLKVVANNERQMNQFIASMERVARRNIFGKANRFGSFAPIRLNCNAQWLVDGRDYFWQVSRALSRAKDRIFIHDWWISPEVYLRRPGLPKYRLDHILKKKAEEGVKIFVIVYNEVSNNFTPTDSNYTKQRLIGLHSNIFVQRSPSHFQTGTFYWAHHEKMCVIDETVAFMGGLDLCFGRWDTSAHILTDHCAEKGTLSAEGDARPGHDPNLLGPGVGGREFYVWPGQDFANERVMEWHDLTKPEIDLFDRMNYPRMPWHDVGLQLVGQPARDLCRHFTQRWNYLLRIKNHKRLMPFLIPPPDFQPSEMHKYDLTGTCEVQICRSAGPWSLGTASTVEHSIQNAYLKAIQMSEHFVYIENQFFVTSTEARGTIVENKIGEALVSRIIRAEREQTPWKAVIVIPLIPGFPMAIDHPDASSVRLIVDLQYRSICRGEESIFGKLRRRGIDPADYISFFSLRQWGKLPSGRLTTEQVYIHAKAMVVDDRLALIGSANINERSQRGDRDSELACIVRDTDLIDSRMAGKPFQVGRFAHSLRIRLMREHLGLDVDAIDAQSAAMQDVRPAKMLDDEDEWDPSREQSRPDQSGFTGKTRVSASGQADGLAQTFKEFAGPVSNGAGREAKQGIRHAIDRVHDRRAEASGDSSGNQREGLDGNEGENKANGDAQIHTSQPRSGEDIEQPMEERIDAIARQSHRSQRAGNEAANSTESLAPTVEERMMQEESAKVADDHVGQKGADTHLKEMKKVMSSRTSINPWAVPSNPPKIDADLFIDPLDERFYRDMWMAAAVHNTQIYRKVFKSVPDDTVTTWPEYKAFQAWTERLSRSESLGQNGHSESQRRTGATDGVVKAETDMSESKKASESIDALPATVEAKHAANRQAGSLATDASEEHASADVGQQNPTKEQKNAPNPHAQQLPHGLGNSSKQMNKAIAGTSVDEGFTPRELEQMESLLQQTCGTLVMFSTRFLEAEDRSDNFLFPMDKINPLNVYD